MATLNIYYHGNCFDGATSAAIFTRFFLDRVDGSATVVHRGMAHRQGDPYGGDHDAFFAGDVNAVLDFRYSPSSRLHWFCDHHHSAFIEPAHREHFAQQERARSRARQLCFDPTAPSCAGLLSRWLVAEHGLAPGRFADHVRWADLIDSASFVDARQAVELAEPALQLMALLESVPSDEIVEAIISGLAAGSIEQTRARPEIDAAVAPVLARHREMIATIGERLRVDGGVGFFDLTDDEVSGFNKFIPYHLADGLSYVVGVTRSATRAKVSVGSNPWRRPEPLQNLAELCGRYGGGGHAVVAAISFPPDEVERARRAGGEIADILRGGAAAAR